MNRDAAELLRKIPQVERILSTPECQALIDAHSRAEVTRRLREDLASLRQRAVKDSIAPEEVEVNSIIERTEAGLLVAAIPYYRRVVNATGIVLHTALGRAPLPTPAVEALAARAGHPVRVEVDLESGERGGRDEGCAELLRDLTGAEDATVVNNNAGATLLILAALARGKKVVLSRGELVEIGGSFRVPDIMTEGGAHLVEVGTTNRTHRKDYESALDDETGLILKVHTSNYMVKGFTKEVEIEELVEIGREHGIPVVHDLGSGCLVDLERRGITGEPHVSRSVSAGADLVCFSGDKLLGGPQSGLIVGTRKAVQRVKTHQMFRALRPDRLTYIALEATLRIYREGEEAALEKIPALKRLLTPAPVLLSRAKSLAQRLEALPGLGVDVMADHSQAGSGSLPTRELPTSVVKLESAGHATGELARQLRLGTPAVLVRVRDDALLLDVRTLEDSELDLIAARLREILEEQGDSKKNGT